MLKKIGIFIIVAVVVVIITILAINIPEYTVKVDMDKMKVELYEKFDITMTELDNIGIKEKMNIDMSYIEDSLVIVPLTSDRVNMVAFLKVKPNFEDSVKSDIEYFIEQYKQKNSNYIQSNIKLIEENKIGQKHNYIYCIIGENKSEVEEVINIYIK